MPEHTSTPNYGRPWSRDELILAFDLYCRIPFQKTKATNPQVRGLAASLGRSPASVARKLGNFGAFDPELRKRDISGLSHTSRLDREIWEEFNSNWSALVLEAHRLRASICKQSPAVDLPEVPISLSERLVTRKQRVHQAFFRESVLSSYDYTCCITGVQIPECLVASHIVPWNEDEKFRADPTNGLCLSATFHYLFDAGLVSLSPDLKVCLSRRVLSIRSKNTEEHVGRFHERPMIPPKRFQPSEDRLQWHRQHVFKG